MNDTSGSRLSPREGCLIRNSAIPRASPRAVSFGSFGATQNTTFKAQCADEPATPRLRPMAYAPYQRLSILIERLLTFTLFGLVSLRADVSAAVPALNLNSSTVHLRSGTQPEWDEFAGKTP